MLYLSSQNSIPLSYQVLNSTWVQIDKMFDRNVKWYWGITIEHSLSWTLLVENYRYEHEYLIENNGLVDLNCGSSLPCMLA
jgi:hypothetical protein